MCEDFSNQTNLNGKNVGNEDCDHIELCVLTVTDFFTNEYHLKML